MILPTPRELLAGFYRFKESEGFSWRTLLSPQKIFSILNRHGYIRFFAVGGGGVVLNLGVTWFFVTFLFGVERYFDAYLIGIGANLVWSFTLYSFALFKTKKDHARRLFIFTIYFIVVTWINTLIVRYVTDLVGVKYYLIVIAGTILVLSTMNFFVFKLSLFKERE